MPEALKYEILDLLKFKKNKYKKDFIKFLGIEKKYFLIAYMWLKFFISQ